MRNIFIAGHNGMVGSAIHRKLSKEKNVKIFVKNRNELDLINYNQLLDFLKYEKIDEVYLAAAKVGGINSNNIYPANFIYENLTIQSNIIHAAYKAGIKKILFLGSSCIYPKLAKQPISENELLNGYLEQTNEPYAIAKIAGIKMCESYNRQYDLDFRSIMPTNLYGPNDNFDLENSHVLPALIRKFHESKINNDDEVIVWGSGKQMREFLHVDDMADGCIYIMNLTHQEYLKETSLMCSHINIGTGEDISIKELAQVIKQITGFRGNIVFDTDKPDGTPRKLLDVSKINKLGWRSSISLMDGVLDTYNWYLKNINSFRGL